MSSNNNKAGVKKYRLITMLTGTSVIGVLLIFSAVYNASRDLELLQDVDTLYSLIESAMNGYDTLEESAKNLEFLSTGNYQVLVSEKNKIHNLFRNELVDKFPSDLNHLELSRVNAKGGHLEIKGSIYTWAKLGHANSDRHIVLVSKYVGKEPAILAKIYSKRILIPGIFYIWLMVWLALIIRFLLNKLYEQNKQLEHLALHDNLTGLPNRNLLNDRLENMLEDCRRYKRKFALVLLDLDRFKEVNDTYGHDQGDRLLCLFANRVQPLIRAADTFARIGGDEFILLLHDTNEEDCIVTCSRIQESVIKPFELNNTTASIGLSIGASIFPDHGEESKTLLRKADEAMYESKSKDGGIIIYAESMLKIAG